MSNKNEIILYQSDDLQEHLEVWLENDTVWLTLNQIAQLFNRDKSVISRYLRNVYKEGELSREATVAKNATVQLEAGREVKREIDYYNLDSKFLKLGNNISRTIKPNDFSLWN
ncbi:MAG: hypothetical protein H6606_05280 [Flavobacteriales bacterium]|nr:hypothetical protein [Flavobacteriales bacterium]